MKSTATLVATVLWVLLAALPAAACVGDACLQLWSTEPGGGALTIRFDFTAKVQTYETFCLPDRSSCLYSTIDPGFMAETEERHSGFYRLRDDTAVRVEILSTDRGLTMSVNGQKLQNPGDSALLGTMPNIHNHPAWQLQVAGDEIGDFAVSFKITTNSMHYMDSDVFTVTVTNSAPPAETPTATPPPTPTPTACAGDCDGDGEVTVDEIIQGVRIALEAADLEVCPSFDVDASRSVSIDELVRAVNAALNGCGSARPIEFAEIQESILTPRCALPTCHTSEAPTANLSLVEGEAYEELINRVPDTEPARDAALLLVAPGEPERSFLMLKVQGPPRGLGSRMPLTGEPLTGEEIELIRNWILQGALR